MRITFGFLSFLSCLLWVSAPLVAQEDVTAGPECDMTGGDCPGGLACWLSDYWTSTCMASNGKDRGEDCSPDSEMLDCGDGLICLAVEGAASCVRLCTHSVGCSAGESCVLPVLDGVDWLGVCICDDPDEDGNCKLADDVTPADSSEEDAGTDLAGAGEDTVDEDSADTSGTDGPGDGPDSAGALLDTKALDEENDVGKSKGSSGSCSMSAEPGGAFPLAALLLLFLIFVSRTNARDS